MPGSTWTTPEQKAFLEQYYSPFLKAQLQATVSQFWIPLYAEWFKKWPEVDKIFKGQTVPVTLSEEQNIALGKAVNARHKKIRTWFNNRSQKSSKAAVNVMTKSITKLMGSKAKGTRVHSEVEVFSKMMYKDSVQDVVKKEIEGGALVTKEEKLRGLKELTRKAYEASSNEVRALCKAKVQEERESKAQVILGGLRGGGSVRPTNEQYAKALEECTGPISHFLQAIQNMTGFEWTVIGAGPDPRLGGKLNALTYVYHTGVNHTGQNWHEFTPDFVERHLNPYLEFIGTIFPEHVRKTRALDYVPQSPDSTTAVTPPTTDFVGAASTSSVSLPVGNQALTPAYVQPGVSFEDFWSFDGSNTDSFIDGTQFVPPSGTEVLLPAHPDASPSEPHTPSSQNEMPFPSLSLPYSPPLSSSQSGTPISSWNREAWNQQVSSPLCFSPPHFRMHHHITDSSISQTSNSDIFGPSYVFPNSHLPTLEYGNGNMMRSGSEPANTHLPPSHPGDTPVVPCDSASANTEETVSAAIVPSTVHNTCLPTCHPGDMTVEPVPSDSASAASEGTVFATIVPSPVHLIPVAPASVNDHPERGPAPVLTTDSDTSSADTISAPSMHLPAQTQAAATTISKHPGRAAAPGSCSDHGQTHTQSCRCIKKDGAYQTSYHTSYTGKQHRRVQNETQGSNHRGLASLFKETKIINT
ncbi:hypothetical protein F4604DRAFT_1952018 [Suillus subluteus]|nr:hypothetical protein F4604DRAFT_1952018 [Suillus subluteus]